MLLDLRLLKRMHPSLPAEVADGWVHHAALALQRRGHTPSSTEGTVTVEADPPAAATIEWDAVDPGGTAQIDRNAITEHGAEVVTLALVSVARGWTTVKKLQRYQWADWLLVTPSGNEVALEISGIDGDFQKRRLREKLDQATKVRFTSARFASVVAFARPEVVVAQA